MFSKGDLLHYSIISCVAGEGEKRITKKIEVKRTV